MSNFRRSAGTLWTYGAVLAALAGGGALVARDHGWLDSVPCSLDDGTDDPASDSSRSSIATVGFEEEAPPAPSSRQPEQTGERNSSGANKPAVAARPTDSTTAIGSGCSGTGARLSIVKVKMVPRLASL